MSKEWYIETAASLPLPDAAFLLWIAARRLNDDDKALSPDIRRIPATSEEIETNDVNGYMKRTMLSWIADCESLNQERTFDRMKLAHPDAADQVIKSAIKAAIKLQNDCSRHYNIHNSRKFFFSALDAARRENPNFLEVTYKRASDDLHWATR